MSKDNSVEERTAVSVASKEGSIEIDLGEAAFEVTSERQVSRHRDSSSKLDLRGEGSVVGHGSTLGEATDDDLVGRSSSVDLGLDEPIY